MKKTMITIMTTIVCMAALCFGALYGMRGYYENKIADMEQTYSKQLNDVEALKSRVDELREERENMYEQIYNMKNHKAYELKIRHDGTTYVYGQEKDGRFTLSGYTVTIKQLTEGEDS